MHQDFPIKERNLISEKRLFVLRRGIIMVENFKEILYDNERLETERLTLRKSTKDDALDILEYGSDANTVKYLDWA